MADLQYNVQTMKRPHSGSVGDGEHLSKQARVNPSASLAEDGSEGPEGLFEYLITTHPNISSLSPNKLLKCILEFYESFKDVSSADILVEKYIHSNPQVWQELEKALVSRNYRELDHLLEQAWKTAYQYQRLPELFYSHINEIDRSAPFSNSMVIINGAGTGKSRMVDKLGQFVFTIYFNLGHVSGAGDSQDPDSIRPSEFPPVDSAIREVLSLPADSSDELVELQFYSFLEATFEVVFNTVRAVAIDPPNYHEQARTWYNYLWKDGIRKGLYEEIARTTKMKIGGGLDSSTSTSPEISTRNEHLRRTKKKLQTLMQWLKHPERERSFILNRDGDERSEKPEPVKLVIALDNAEVLSAKYPNAKQSHLDIMLRCFSELRENLLFGLALGRPNAARELVKPPASYAETPDSTVVLHAPFTEIVFDIHPLFPLNPEEEDVRNTASHLESMVRYGRLGPWSVYQAARETRQFTEGQLYEMAMDSARADFLECTTIPVALEAAPRWALISLLQYLLCITPGGRGRTMLQEHSSRLDNIRIVQSIPTHRQYVVSHYPSEPLMREALLQQVFDWFRPTSTSNSDSPPSIDEGLSGLGLILESPLINEGMNGEVIASLLILRAYVRGHILAFGGKYRFQTEEAYPRVQPRPQRETFLATQHAHGTLNSFPRYEVNDDATRNFSQAFHGATVRFTGFERAADDIVVSAEGLRAAYIRGFGIIGHKTQKGLDFLLPVRLKNDRFTFLGFQVKNRMSEVPIPDLIFDADGYGIFGDSKEREPYLLIVMQLGVRVPTEGRGVLQLQKTRKAAQEQYLEGLAQPVTPPRRRVFPEFTTPQTKLVTTTTPLRRGRSAKEDAHPLYFASVTGCTEKTYKVIHEKERDHFARILARRDACHEHPRRGEFLDLLRRTKAEWFMGRECFGWIEEMLLQGRKRLTDQGLQTVEEDAEQEVEESNRDEGGTGQLQEIPTSMEPSSPLTSLSDNLEPVDPPSSPLTPLSDDRESDDDARQRVHLPADGDRTGEAGDSIDEESIES
ncbi:hypothetical protein C8T65DRAFT_696364 [Cerioporus squamosus]|nr:hypothetical protein C8T65DRAFT_696364 [Cerioporus squamosus]